MATRHVVFTFNHLPYGSVYYAEGLRAAVGVTAGIDEHTVDLVYLGDGVNFALKGLDRTDSARYLATFEKQGVKLKVEKESLEARNISPAELAADTEIITHAQALQLIKTADLTVDF